MMDVVLAWTPSALDALSPGRWAVVLAVLGAVLYHNRIHAPHYGALIREAALVVAAYFAYFLVRGATEGNVDVAFSNARGLIDFERAAGMYHERWLQDLITGRQWMVDVANWVYVWGHWPVIALAATWLFLARRRRYYVYRNAFLISGAIGLVVFALYPVAPPRLSDAGITDTVTLYSSAYRVLQPPALVNQYAAMPSLHFGWNLLIGIALVREAPRWEARVFGLMLPPLMWLSVVMTGNHFIIDTVAGAALALFGLAAASLMASGALTLRNLTARSTRVAGAAR